MWRFYQVVAREKPKGGDEEKSGSISPFRKISELLDNIAVYRKFLYSELFLCLVVAGIFIVCLIIAIIIQVVLATSQAKVFDPVCQKTCKLIKCWIFLYNNIFLSTGNAHEGIALKVLSIFCELAIFIYVGLVVLMKDINDEFSIRNELLVLCLFSFICVSIMVVIQFVPCTLFLAPVFVNQFFLSSTIFLNKHDIDYD